MRFLSNLVVNWMSCFALSLASQAVFASDLRGVLRAGYSSGGEAVEKAISPGNLGLEAGDGWLLAIGTSYSYGRIGLHLLELELSLGYLRDQQGDQTSGEATFHRYPIELIQYFGVEPWRARFGLGLTRHVEVSLEGNGLRENLSSGFSPSLGILVLVETLMPLEEELIGLGLKYTDISYRSDLTGRSVSGDSWMIYLSYYPRLAMFED